MKTKSLKSSPKKSREFFISIDQEKEKNKRKLPKIKILTTDEKINDNSKEKSKEKKRRMNKSKKQLKELNDLYCLVSNNKENFFDKYPSQSVEKYFKKYTKKRLPILNIKKGSNVHGLFDDFQQIVSKNNLNKITKSSNDIKKRLGNNTNSSFNQFENNSFDLEKIQEMDEKIPVMHYIFAEELMTKKSTNDE